MSYHNTTSLFGQELYAATEVARFQDDLVLAFMKERAGYSFTPCDVWGAMIRLKRINKNVPVTSIRRSISDLVKEGKLVKLAAMRKGAFGKRAHLHQYVQPN